MFNELMKLQENDAFYFSDQDIKIKDTIYTVRSFSYRLASYSMFDIPYAKESRGTAYYTVKGKEDWKLFCRAYSKFFNLNEGMEKSEYMKDNPVLECYEKMDGSLILAGQIGDKLVAKSKTSLNSEQAEMAQKFLDTHAEYRAFCEASIEQDCTPVFEGIGRDNVIVLRYNVDFELVLLGIIDNKTGEVLTFDELPEYKNIKIAKVYNKTWEELLEIQETSKPDIEGFVVKSSKGLCKIKVSSYVDLHHLKDSVNNKKSLVSLILDDNLDDLIGSFRDDKATIDYVLEEQDKISHVYNALVKTVEDTFEENKELERKEFAIKNQQEHNGIFGLLMAKYLGKDVDYKTFFMKNKMYE